MSHFVRAASHVISSTPIPEDVVFRAEFTSSQGKLLLNKEPFQVKGVN